MRRENRSNSELTGLSPLSRLLYSYMLFTLHAERRNDNRQIAEAYDDVIYCTHAVQSLLDKGVNEIRALELGVGQRPLRLFMMRSMKMDVWGIDLDAPIYRFDLNQLYKVLRANGIYRLIKSVFRYVLFDRQVYLQLAEFLRSRNIHLTRDMSRHVVGDIKDSNVWQSIGGKFDLIYSHDVFEHIPEADIVSVIDNMSAHMSDQSLAIIAPLIFTGVTGGHQIGWYRHQLNRIDKKRGPAWGHLTGETRSADTYLNRLTREDYRQIFSRRFEIISESNVHVEIGKHFLTPERRAAIPKKYSDEDLLSNKVVFVMKKLNSPAPIGL